MPLLPLPWTYWSGLLGYPKHVKYLWVDQDSTNSDQFPSWNVIDKYPIKYWQTESKNASQTSSTMSRWASPQGITWSFLVCWRATNFYYHTKELDLELVTQIFVLFVTSLRTEATKVEDSICANTKSDLISLMDRQKKCQIYHVNERHWSFLF